MIHLNATMFSLLIVIAPSIAQAHVTLKQKEAPGGATYEAVLTVGHGCEGAATVAVRVQIPDGVVSVKPMPKPGWQLETRVEPYSQPVEAAHGETYTEGVREIAWSGGNLPDDWYDVFSFRVQLPDVEPGTKIYFPVVQECTEGVNWWIDVPAGEESHDNEGSPAPMVTISAGSTESHN